MHEDHATQNLAEAEVLRRIAVEGRITFAEFMRITLYHPEGGYYTTRKAIGAEGDYFTSPSAHPAFGALLAMQLERMWEVLGKPETFYTVEMGAGDGLMARDLMDYAEGLHPEFAEALEYVTTDLTSSIVPVLGVTGCVISNELVDAFPVHRFRIDDGTLLEVFVTNRDTGELTEELGEPSTPLVAQRLEKLERPLPDGFAGEVNLEIVPWMERVSDVLHRGFVITIDYGHEADQLYSPSRSHGTLQTYFRHTGGSNPYQRIGRQDITAQVDFSAVVEEGRAAGLAPMVLLSQSEYLNDLGMVELEEKMNRMPLDSYQRDANLMALRELVKPGGLGGFLVLIQQKGVGVQSYEMLMPTASRIQSLEVPLLRAEHTPLYAGRYPQHELDLDQLWPFREPERQDPR